MCESLTEIEGHPPMKPATLVFRDVHKAFAAVPVLRGLCLTLPLEGITFVVGQSGSGKSVLCRLAVGLAKPDSGEVELLGERVDLLPERALQRLRAHVPYLVQSHALLDWLTLERNVALANPDPARVAGALAAVGLEAVAQRLPPEVGPGVRKRAAIARALVLAPRALILDEPTTGLDRAAAGLVNDTLARLRGLGVGVVAVSHDYRALGALADQVVEVRAGTVGYVGPPGPFLEAAKHPWTNRELS
jgi:phospholipid/cholesterol/gamma-HCH transport system ATP-binding protein